MIRRSLVTTAGAVFASLALTRAPVWAADVDTANGTLLDRYVAAFNAHDTGAFSSVIGEDYVQHNGRAGQGLAGLQEALRTYFQTFPDFHVQVEDRIFAGDRVVARNTLTATHTQPVALGSGAPVFPPTGKKLTWAGIDIWRVAGGKFAENWDETDFLGLARQLRGS